jgi:uncharacterized protein
VFFSVKELEVKKIRFDVTFPPGEIEYYDQRLRQATPLQAQGVAELLSNTLGEIRVKGRVSVTIEADCDRCLEAARFPIDSEFDLFYRPLETSTKGADEVEIDPGESEIGFYEGGGLQLKDILREFILLSMPMQRVCSDACQGICPFCGQNRNVVKCGCEVKTVDDRWSALKKLSVKGI